MSEEKKLLPPLKFVPTSIQEEYYKELIHKTWIPLRVDSKHSLMQQFTDNNLRVKEVTKN